MKVYQPNEIKNIVLVGNAGSGKTTLSESMLFHGGIVSRRGEVESKNTVSDYRDVEHETGNSVYSTVLYTELNGKKINIIDAPGSDNFISGAISGMKVADTAVMVLNARSGVEVGTEIMWRYCRQYEKPTLLLINQLDHESANFEKAIEDAKLLFGNKVVQVQYPLGTGEKFEAIIDVLTMKMYKYGSEGGMPEVLDIPESEADKAAEMQNTLVEAAAENDDALMEIYFEKESLTEDEMRAGIITGLINHDIIPVFCASAKSNKGIHRFMQFITNVAPSPDQMPAPKTTTGEEIKCDINAPTSLFVFKTSIEPHLGEVNFFKVISGKITEGTDLINREKDNKERFSQLYLVAGKNRTKVSELVAGDIGAAVKLKDTKSNQTLTLKEIDYKINPITYPEPKHRAAIVCINEADDEKLGEALHRLRNEDPTLILEYSKELKQLILHGQGEYHLNTIKWHLDNEFKIETQFIAPKIPYRETITKYAQADYRHKKQSGGSGQFGEVHLVIEPFEEGKPDPKSFKLSGKVQNVSVRDKQEFELKWGGKLVFYNCIVGGVIDARFMPAILKGINEKMEEGPLTGSYARDIRVSVYYGKMHPVDSNEISFKLAGAKAFSDAFKKANPKIMEPIFDMDVLVPSDRMGDVMSDLQGRRAIIMGMNSEGGYEKITVKVPLSEMSNYSTSLRSATNGRATYSMRFAEYSQVPGEIQDKLLKEYEASQEES